MTRPEKAICALCVTLHSALSVCAVMPEVAGFRAPAQSVHEAVKDFLWIEAESFKDYGGWRIDTQFTHKMGSAYLLAAGVLKPLASAKTTVDIPTEGDWRAWVRTKDWLPEWHPGRFRLSIGGKPGPELGANGKEGWRWEMAGDWSLAAGTAALSLEDLTGAFARCDAIILTRDLSYIPPDEMSACESERARLTGVDCSVSDAGAFDLVVVGAGPGGMGTAIAAARHGASVALVHDRPVLGGNSSCELGVPLRGAAVLSPNAREGGICEEALLRRALTAEGTLSAAFREMTETLPNLKVFPNQRVMLAEKDGPMIVSVTARDTLTGVRRRWRGKYFADCTGDGWLGVFSGAERMYGREAQSEYNEAPAPEKRDDLTMSGCIMDGYLGYRQMCMGTDNVPYVTPEWARILPPGFTRNVSHPNSEWWVEHGGRFDDLADPERARDELYRLNLAYWGWLKNEWKGKDSIKCNALVAIGHMNGRREGYRLVGDYVLTANDCLEGRMFDDRISYGGWPLDTHDPLGMDNPNSSGYWRHHPRVPIYTIPFRCLYSVNVPNLLVAGRSISVTHIALGSTRVQATILTLGQAVGTAVAQMLGRGLMPREFGRDPSNIRALQQALLKDDQYIPGLVNEDPDDLARHAKVSATSACRVNGAEKDAKPENVVDGVSRKVGASTHCWVSDPAKGFPQTLTIELQRPALVDEVRLTFDSDLNPIDFVGDPLPPTLVKAYAVEGFDGKEWSVLADVRRNGLRHRVHGFAPRVLTAVRLRVDATWGSPSARVFEVRVQAAKPVVDPEGGKESGGRQP